MARFLRVIGARRYAEVGRLVRGWWGNGRFDGGEER